MSSVCTTASPLSCYWIAAGSEKRVGDYAYAVCQRSRGHDRIVNEADCARCPLWREPADDVKEQVPSTFWSPRIQAFRR